MNCLITTSLTVFLALTGFLITTTRADGHHHVTIEEEELHDIGHGHGHSDWKPKWEPKWEPKWDVGMERYYPHYGHSSKTDDICLILLVIGIATAVGLATIIGPMFMMFFTMTNAGISAGGQTIVTAGGIPAMGRRRRSLKWMKDQRIFEVLRRLSQALNKYETT